MKFMNTLKAGLGVVVLSSTIACLPSSGDSDNSASNLKSITIAKPNSEALAKAYGEKCKDVVFVDLTNKLAEASGKDTVPLASPDCDYIVSNVFTQYQIKIKSGDSEKNRTDEFTKPVDVKLEVEKNHTLEYSIGYVNPTDPELKFHALFTGSVEITSEQLKAEASDILKVSIKVKTTEAGKAWGFAAKAAGDKKIEVETEFDKPE